MTPISTTTSSTSHRQDHWQLSEDGQYWIFTQPLEKSDNDDRVYRLIKLASNDLEVLLVHDKDTDKSSAALDVHVGHISDPHDLQGLAHFCEHLLFMGTEKYPKENDYNQFLAEHSGFSNAFTGVEDTNYYFEVDQAYLEGALDRFAQFFISPLFSDSCTERELKAVDSEHKKNRQQDSWRMFQLEKSLSNPNHPYCHFGTGNLETLYENPKKSGQDIRQELLKFHDTYYSANIMKLCILGRESLDQLTEWTVSKFNAVRNKDIQPPSFPGHPLTKNELMKQIFVKPVKDVRSLEMTFPFPDQRPLYAVQPGRYLSHLIGHEGRGSILSLLKKHGWANYLQVGTIHGGIGFEFMRISVDLTQQGLAHYREVIQIIFEYIHLLKKDGVQARIFEEVQSLASLAFRFKEKYPPSQYTSRLAGLMQHGYPEVSVLSGPSLIRHYDPELIKENLDYLCPDNFRIMLASQTPPNGIEFTQREKWYGTEYNVVDFDEDLIKSLQNIKENPSLAFPEPNTFIPENFETFKKEVTEPQRRPDLIEETDVLRLWHKKDDTFWVPRANVWITLQSPLAYATPANCVKTRLYADLLTDALNEYAYDAEVAGLSYNIENQLDGLLLAMGGYNDKLPILLERVVSKMRDFTVDAERFQLIKDQLCRSYKNFALEPPYQHALYYLSYLTQDKMWTNAEKLQELESITAEDIQAFYPTVLAQLHVEALVHGNVVKEEAQRMLRQVIAILQPKPLLPHQRVRHHSLLLPHGSKYVYHREVEDPHNVNSGIEYLIQVGNVTQTTLRAQLSLLAQIAQEPCFDQLRTKEQLGYLVFSGVRKQTGSMGLRFILQSERDTVYLENRIEAFLTKLRQLVENMSEKEYQAQVRSLVNKKLEKNKNLGQEGGKYWTHIHSGYYEFDQIEKDIKELNEITKEDILEFIKEYVDPASPRVRKLSVHIQSQKTKASSPASASAADSASASASAAPRKAKEKKYKVSIESLHTCLVSQGVTRLSIEDVRSAVEKGDAGEASIEANLRTLLADESQADEEAIEACMAKLMSIMRESSEGADGAYVSVDSQKTARRLSMVQPTESMTATTQAVDHTQLPAGNIMITNVTEFKSSMELSPAAVPLIDLDSCTI
ncbi:Metalloenzyme, LuxS/M16 peptidase-like protein [Mycotypha africana]|uniref:Metalloenzyme, LuxS/M16 peptidase-like protein n=1 Tax=Mycotypha africana TaxID=64632 RepID=UPI002301D878|nr:Metalloenzyme, LuxS/M16 peptidase-like protein [Mycotypha africana]KAI8967298.1 Metalloenzyme, LuxS/M16 peptidase-like protein [Mycotypha africana]